MIIKVLSDGIQSDGKHHPGSYFKIILMQEPVNSSSGFWQWKVRVRKVFQQIIKVI